MPPSAHLNVSTADIIMPSEPQAAAGHQRTNLQKRSAAFLKIWVLPSLLSEGRRRSTWAPLDSAPSSTAGSQSRCADAVASSAPDRMPQTCDESKMRRGEFDGHAKGGRRTQSATRTSQLHGRPSNALQHRKQNPSSELCAFTNTRASALQCQAAQVASQRDTPNKFNKLLLGQRWATAAVFGTCGACFWR